MEQVRHLEHRGPAYLQRDGRRQRVQKACCVDRGPRAASCDEAHDRAHGRDDGQDEPGKVPDPGRECMERNRRVVLGRGIREGESHLSREEEEGTAQDDVQCAERGQGERGPDQRGAGAHGNARQPPPPGVRLEHRRCGRREPEQKHGSERRDDEAGAHRDREQGPREEGPALRRESLRQVDECQRGHQVRDGGLVVVRGRRVREREDGDRSRRHEGRVRLNRCRAHTNSAKAPAVRKLRNRR